MVHEPLLDRLRELADAADAHNTTLFQLRLGDVLDEVAGEGLAPERLQPLGEELCREFGMDEGLAHQVAVFVGEAPGDPGVPSPAL